MERRTAYTLVGVVAAIGALGAAAALARGSGTGPGNPQALSLDFLVDASVSSHLDFLSDDAKKYLRAGDGFMVHIPVHECSDISSINDAIGQLATIFPGAPAVPQNACEDVGDVITGFSGACDVDSAVAMVAMDYEPADTSCFVKTQAGTLTALENFASLAHAHGFQAAGYLTGQGLGHLGWNYGQLFAPLDWMWVETQAHVAAGAGASAMTNLGQQFGGAGAPTSKLEGQASTGKGGGNTDQILDAMAAAQAIGCTRWLFEWGDSASATALLDVLEQLRPSS
jgi:hypothetical protein